MGWFSELLGAPSQSEVDAQDAALARQNLRYEKGGDLYNTIAEKDGAFAADSVLQQADAHAAADVKDDANVSGQVNGIFVDTIKSSAHGNYFHNLGDYLAGNSNDQPPPPPKTFWLYIVLGLAGVAFLYFGGLKLLKKS